MQARLVSVIMISYNSSKFIREAIESVISQTYTHFELIIVDDNSKDNTWEIVQSYEDKRIRKYRNEINLGEYPNRNKAIEYATGEYLIFIDADDIIYSHGLEFMMRFANSFPECGMIISRPWDERIILPLKISSEELYCFEYLDRGAIGINFTKVLFKTQAMKCGRLFPQRVKLGDLYIQYEIALRFPSLIIPDASTWWRRTRGQASEKLLKQYALYLKHELWIKLEKLEDPLCPLSQDLKDVAYTNLYGNYMRFLIRQLLKLKISTVIALYKQYPVPRSYFLSFMIKPKRQFYSRYSGNNPLQSKWNAR